MKNKLKIYLRTKENIKKQAQIYEKVFNGKILKYTESSHNIWTFAYIQIIDDINILIAKHYNNMPSFGYSADYVISIFNENLFYEIVDNMKKSDNFKMDYDVSKYNWGTKIAKFYDSFGYAWIVETKA